MTGSNEPSWKTNPRCDEEQLAMLLRCSEAKEMTEWNDWRESNPGEEIWLQGVDVSHAHLEAVNLSGAHLEGACLDQAYLAEACIDAAHLVEATLVGAHLDGVIAQNACLQGAELRQAQAERVTLVGARLEGANLRDAHLEKALLLGASLQGAFLEDVHLERANLTSAHLEGATLEGAHLEGAGLEAAHFEGAKLFAAYLEGAILDKAYLQRAILSGASLRGAQLPRAHLEGATLIASDLAGAKVANAHLESACFALAIVDGETLFHGCTVDRKTDFTGVGLGTCRIDSGLKQTLEYNIRRKRWTEWYAVGPKWQRPFRRVVQLFWAISDYGHRTWPIAAWFGVLSVLFALAYRFLPGLVVCSDGKPLAGLWHAVYFSVVTMTTLGFGDIHASRGSPWGQFLLMFQVILGYVLLGALVCRLAILFQAGGPAAKFSKPPKPKREEAAETDE